MLADLRAILGKSTEASPDARKLVSASESFDRQWGYVTSAARRNVLMCGRRAGKTSGILLRVRRLLTTKPNCRIIIATLIRRNCRKLLWNPLLRALDKAGWNYKSNGTDLVLTLENGSWLQALSCSGMDDLKTIRGDSCDLFIIDESQEPVDDVLEALVVSIATPMCIDRGGSLDIVGTVPAADPSFMTECIDSGRYSVFGWSCFDNPFLDPAEITRTCEESGLTPAHPIYQREILGMRVKDPASQAYEYQRGRNDYNPDDIDFTSGKWSHTLGLDLGFQDKDAIMVLAWRRDDPDRRIYGRFQWQRNHLSVDSLYEVVASCLPTYRPIAIVGDHGGHGAVKVLETLKERLRINILAKPPDVMVSVGFVNDDFRTGRLKLPTKDVETARVIETARKRLETRPQLAGDVVGLLSGSHGDLPTELGQVLRTVNPRNRRIEINKRAFHSDLSEALRYAHSAAQNWRAKAPAAELSYVEKRLLKDQARFRDREKW